jgi:3-dehydroquinate synthase
MKKLSIAAEIRYEVTIGDNYVSALKEIKSEHQKVLVLIPTKLKRFIQIKSSGNLFVLYMPDGELQKQLSSLSRVWNELARHNFGRLDAIVGLGGGATTDLAGFAAATWLRGISWYAIPTSLAAMVDASIGGKTGINARSGKNLIGAFYSPRKVIIDLDFLQHLPKRDISAGMAEVIKCGFIKDKNILDLLKKDVLDFEEIIFRSVRVKAKVVGVDFRESKVREVLNYGHTLGHAIESDSKYKLRHGEAVSIGLVFAAELSQIVRGLDKDVVKEHREILQSFNLPISYPKSKFQNLLKNMQVDKKVKNGRLRFIGLDGVCKPVWLEEVSKVDIAKAYERIAK